MALDGDGDRVIFCDENGAVIDGDAVMAICAAEMAGQGKLNRNTLVVTIMSNLGLEIAMRQKGIELARTRVGDRYVLEEMLNSGYNLGGEQSGHIIFLDYNTTGDGILTALQLLAIMKQTGKPLSELAKIYNPMPQVLVNVPVVEKKDFASVPEVNAVIKHVEEKLGDSGRVLVRYSGTEAKARVMLEGEDETEIKDYAAEIAGSIKKFLG
jgi:phosphoglucosamine mutase